MKGHILVFYTEDNIVSYNNIPLKFSDTLSYLYSVFYRYFKGDSQLSQIDDTLASHTSTYTLNFPLDVCIVFALVQYCEFC